MQDMLGESISAGDLFLIPGGNARFGGLVIEVGIVLSTTQKMLKTYVSRFDKIKCKPINKTPRKVLKVTNPSQNFLQNESVKELLKKYETHREFNNKTTKP